MNKTIALAICSLFSYALASEKTLFKDFWSIAETIHTLQQKSFRTVNTEQIIQAGLKAMVNEVDAHSTFFTPQSYTETLQFTNGEFAGVGISANSKAVNDESLLIIDVIVGGPSDKAGIEQNDRIVEVDGTKIKGLTTDEVINLLKGNCGTTVTIKLIRDKKPLTATVTRQMIKDLNCTAYYFEQQKACYISIKAFTDKTPLLVKNHLKKAYREKCESIIIDLRRNSGGVLEAAVHTAGLFVPYNSLIVQTKTRKNETLRSYKTKVRPIHTNEIPVFIITDNFTASAAEILAGSLQHYSLHAPRNNTQQLLLFIVGMPTYGKGSVQELIPMNNGCALKLTSALYYLPNDTSIQAIGIQPDMLLYPKKAPLRDLKWIEEMYGKETALANHISRAEVTGTSVTEENGETHIVPEEKTAQELEQAHQKAISEDIMIRKCINLAKLCKLAQQDSPAIARHRTTLYKYLQEHNIGDEAITIRLL